MVILSIITKILPEQKILSKVSKRLFVYVLIGSFSELYTNLQSMLGVKRFITVFFRAAEFLLTLPGVVRDVARSVLFTMLAQITFRRKLLSTLLALEYIAFAVADHMFPQVRFIVGLVTNGAFLLFRRAIMFGADMSNFFFKGLKLYITQRAPEMKTVLHYFT